MITRVGLKCIFFYVRAYNFRTMTTNKCYTDTRTLTFSSLKLFCNRFLYQWHANVALT